MPKRKSRTASEAVTVAFPQALPVRRETAEVWWVTLPERELRLSNLTKIFWPEEGYTKGDLLAYYFNVAHLLLPHLERRPLTMKRMPNGMDGDSFYEKTAPSHTPDWVHRCTVLSEDAKEGRIDYLTIDDLSMLLFVANLGAIEMHPLHSRCGDTEHPDYLFFDLDPFPPYTYEDVLTVARHVKVRARPARLDRLPEDERRDRAADLRPDRGGTVDLRRGTGVRRRVRADDRPRRPRPRDDGLAHRRPHRQDLHRPQHEPAGRQHRGRLFAATRAARAGLDAAHVGRGRGRRLRAPGLPDRQRLGTLRRGRRPVGAGAGRPVQRPRAGDGGARRGARGGPERAAAADRVERRRGEVVG